MNFLTSKVNKILESIQEYLETKVKIAKIEVADRLSVILSDIVVYISFAFFFIMFLIFGSVSLSICLNQQLRSGYLGFAITGSIWLLLGFCIYGMRRKVIERKIRDNIIQKIFKSPNKN